MRQAWLQIELRDDCVLSERNATAGAHRSLDYIPGSALLGVAATTLYPQLAATEALQIFHAGAVRFGNGWPLDADGSLGRPLPLALHCYKVDAPKDANGVLTTIVNRLFDYRGAQQLKGMRAGFVTPAGRWLQPTRVERLKTAIDSTTGRAAEGQLFGYQSLARGQRFATCIEADDDIPDGLWRRVVDALVGPRLIGRSRAGEYGRVGIARLDVAPPTLPTQAPPRVGGHECHFLWLLSDLAPMDTFGAPTGQFDPEAMGLPGVTMDFARSFARTRRYSPWNAARHAYDQERSVWVAGSVLCLVGAAPAAATLARGLGLYREQGLGRVCLDPAFLATREVRWTGAAPAEQPSVDATRPSSALLDWLEAKHGALNTGLDAKVDEWSKKIADTIATGRRQCGVADDENFGPSASQWGRVQEAAAVAPDAASLQHALFERDNGIIKTKGEGWDEAFRIDGEWQTLAKWLCMQYGVWQDDTQIAKQLPRFVQQLTHRLRVKERH